MSLEWEQTVVDARDPVTLGNWWRDALGWVVVNDDPAEFEIRPAADRLPGLVFVRVPDRKTVKNRLHLDFRPDDRDAEVERLRRLGATRADIGQGEPVMDRPRRPGGERVLRTGVAHCLAARAAGGGNNGRAIAQVASRAPPR